MLSAAALKSCDVAAYRDIREKCVSAQSIKHELGLLHRILKTAVIDWGIHLPHGLQTNLVRKPKLPQGRNRRLYADEESKLLARAKKSRSNDIENIIIVAIETAARRGEISSMRWEYIDLNKCTWHIPKTKTDTPRTIPLSSRVVTILKSLPQRTDGFVWSLRRNDGITQAFRRVCTKRQKDGTIIEKFPGLRFHDLRHEATSRFFENGLNIMEVSTITGHKDLQSLKRYTHLKAKNLVAKPG